MESDGQVADEETGTMIRLEKIGKAYRTGNLQELKVLKDLDFEIKASEVASIRGASGSGKSTLLNLIGSLDTPTDGRVLWNGEDIAKWSKDERADWRLQKVGFIFQAYHLLPELTVLENVMVPCWLARKPDEKRAETMLEEVGLSGRLKHLPGELSGGEQQRVAIARAMSHDPDLILADEPTGNLDRSSAETVIKLLLDLARQKKKALVLVTHDQGLAERAESRWDLAEGKLRLLRE